MKNDTWWLTSSALSVTDTPTVGWSSGGTDCSLSLERLGGCRMKAPSIVTGRRVRSVLLFSNPSRLTSVLPSDWFPQHRWICVEHTSPLPQMTVTVTDPHVHVELYLNSGLLREKEAHDSVTAADTHRRTLRLKVWTEEVLERFTGDIIAQEVIIEREVWSFRRNLHWAGDQLRIQTWETFRHATRRHVTSHEFIKRLPAPVC